MTADHAAALRVIDFSAIDGGSRMLCESALPELAALYRAGVEYEAAISAMDAVDASDTASIDDVRAGLERIRAARTARKAALAAVADKLTKGEGK